MGRTIRRKTGSGQSYIPRTEKSTFVTSWLLKSGYFEDPDPCVIQVQTLLLEGPRMLKALEKDPPRIFLKFNKIIEVPPGTFMSKPWSTQSFRQFQGFFWGFISLHLPFGVLFMNDFWGPQKKPALGFKQLHLNLRWIFFAAKKCRTETHVFGGSSS